jgi:hypothetical protein
MYTALLTALVLWISTTCNLPADYHHPNIKLVSAEEITRLRYSALSEAQQYEILTLQRSAAAPPNRRETVALYDDRSDTIFLPDGWTGDTPADLSVLVHELVHHLQNKAGIRYECPGAREELAYAEQEKWLALFDRSLLSEFQIDPFTLKVSTTCGF